MNLDASPEYFDVLTEGGALTGRIKLRSDVHRDGTAELQPHPSPLRADRMQSCTASLQSVLHWHRRLAQSRARMGVRPGYVRGSHPEARSAQRVSRSQP